MLKVAVVVCLLGFCRAQLELPNHGALHVGEKFNVNKSVDDLLPQINQLIRSAGLDSVALPDVYEDGRPLVRGVRLSGLAALVRAGDAEMELLTSLVPSVEAVLRVESPRVLVRQGPGTPLALHFAWVEFRFRLELVPSPVPAGCSTQFRSFQITHVGDVQAQPPGTWTANWIPILSTQYNKWLSDPATLGRMGKTIDLCKPSIK